MRILRTVILAIGLAAVATACGGKDKSEATTPDNTGGDTGGGDMGGDTYGGDMGGGDMGGDMGGDEGANPCGGEANPCG